MEVFPHMLLSEPRPLESGTPKSCSIQRSRVPLPSGRGSVKNKNMRKTIFIKILTLIFMTLSLSHCGFHPRGTTTFAPPMQRLYIKTQSPYGELVYNLRAYFKMSGVYLTETPQSADTVLDIMSEETGQQLLGINGSQQTSQYNLTLIVTFQLLDSHGNAILMPEKVSETRTLAINSNQILGGSNEADALYQQMRRTIVFDIANRLSSREVTAILNRQNKKS